MKNQSDELVAPKYDETDEQRRKMGTNSKMKRTMRKLINVRKTKFLSFSLE